MIEHIGNMDTPYFNTYLYTTVTLHPSQMNNDIYKHLKGNLIKDLQGKCYKGYGHISKIYKIEDRKGGYIVAEDSSASATYQVKFSCKLCRPLKNTTIICEVQAINKSLIYVTNGPINVLIFEGHDQINQNNFIFDEKRNALLANIGNGKGIPVSVGTYVKIKVIGSLLENGSQKIIVMGNLENLATKKESDEAIMMKENDGSDYIEYNEYIKQELVDNNDNPDGKKTEEFPEESVTTESETETETETETEDDGEKSN